MPRLLVLNNYSFERVWSEVRAGDKPDHHLFGLNYFADAGYDVELMPFRSKSGWQRFQSLLQRAHFPVPLGNLDQQAAAWKRRGQADLIYAPCQTETSTLAYLRRWGLLRIPMVCLAHHPFERGRLAPFRRPFLRMSFRGTDRFPSLSRNVAAEINGLGARPISETIPWGPQRDYYERGVGPGQGALAAGRTGRDFTTFGQAATQAGTEARIICLQSTVTPGFAQFGSNVTVDAHPDRAPLGYRALIAAFARARVLAVPMFAGPSLAGLTSITDALAVGKPVIVTRNAQLDIDIEGLGIGRWIDPGDVQGWKEALRWFDQHPDEAMVMGARARALVDGGLNSAAFARRMMTLFEAVLAENRASRA